MHVLWVMFFYRVYLLKPYLLGGILSFWLGGILSFRLRKSVFVFLLVHPRFFNCGKIGSSFKERKSETSAEEACCGTIGPPPKLLPNRLKACDTPSYLICECCPRTFSPLSHLIYAPSITEICSSKNVPTTSSRMRAAIFLSLRNWIPCNNELCTNTAPSPTMMKVPLFTSSRWQSTSGRLKFHRRVVL